MGGVKGVGSAGRSMTPDTGRRIGRSQGYCKRNDKFSDMRLVQLHLKLRQISK